MFSVTEKSVELLPALYPKKVKGFDLPEFARGPFKQGNRGFKTMDTGRERFRFGCVPVALGFWLAGSTSVSAQEQPPPAQEPFGNLPRPAVPQPTTPAVAAAPGSREAALEARIQQLEAIVNQLQYQVGNGGPAMGPGLSSSYGPGADTPAREAVGGTGGLTGGSSYGPGVPGQSFPPVPPVSPRFNVPATLDEVPSRVRFGPGFEIINDDEEWIMQFHDLTQFD